MNPYSNCLSLSDLLHLAKYPLGPSMLLQIASFHYFLWLNNNMYGPNIIKIIIGMDLTEAEDSKTRWQEDPEELYKKDLHDPDNHDGVTTHLEPDILECESQVSLRKHHYKPS